MILLKFIIQILVVFTVTFLGNCDAKFQNEEYRLNKTVWPEHYKLELLVVLDEIPDQGFEPFTAPAKSWITVNCSASVSTITLHAINLTVNENTLKVIRLASGTEVPVEGISYREEFHFLEIHLGELTEEFQLYEIYIEFITPISGDRLNGMYQDSYRDPNTGEIKSIATTLFAPFHARRAFPCFDEPSFRATYDITLGHHTKYHAMSNAHIVDSRPVDNMTNWQWDTFATTPSISSYIIAMIVSDMAYEEGPENGLRNVSVRIYAKPQSIEQGHATYSAKLVGDVITFFESLFLVEYPLTKLYSVALPQFYFSAMENWGLITYKEPTLLYAEGESSEAERYTINSVVSHEKAHQWFGNLVACDWWAYVWLKEGFATYFSYHGMNHTNPELVPWVQFLSKSLYTAMNFDATNRTHPLENFPPTSEEVANIYTSIPYQKGASILRMASSILTETVFLDGVKSYVNEFQYGSAVQDDMFEQLQGAVNRSSWVSSALPSSVKSIMDTWTRQSGFPMLTFTAPADDFFEISQRKFIGGDPSNPDTTWWVPIYLYPRLNSTLPDFFPDAWIPQNSTTVQIQMSTNQVIIVNPDAMGYYRVVYEAKLLDKILRQLEENHLLIPESGRSVLLNDYAQFAQSGITEMDTFIQLTSYLDRETSLVVWDGLSRSIEKMGNILGNSPAGDKFKSHFGNKLAQALKLLESQNPYNNLKGETALTRSLLLKLACSLGEKSCLQKSKDEFINWRTKLESRLEVKVSTPEGTLLCAAVSEDLDGFTWSYIYTLLRSSFGNDVFSPARHRLIEALTCSQRSEDLQRLVGDIKSGTSGSVFSLTEKADILQSMVKQRKGCVEVLLELRKSTVILEALKSDEDFQNFMFDIGSYILSNEQIETLHVLSHAVSKRRSLFVQDAISQTEESKGIYQRFMKYYQEIK